jgi:pimeloyl-ACP methyl ester carboxylesterase
MDSPKMQTETYHPRLESRSSRYEIRGVDYHIREWGEPGHPLLILLHGWGDCSASFQFLADNLEQEWFIVAPDWRGFGETQHRASSYWFPDYLADLDVLLSIYSPGEPVNLLGHSMGANAAGLFAGVFPERVKAFVNVEGFGLADSDPASAPGTYRRWIETSRIMPGYRHYDDFDALAMRILKRSPSMGEDKALFIARSWAERDDDGRVVLRADPAHKLPNAVQYRRAEARACWAEVAAPVLLILGEDTDFRAEFKDWLDPDDSKHPFHGAHTEVIPGAGHMVHFEQPAALARAVERFLETMRR